MVTPSTTPHHLLPPFLSSLVIQTRYRSKWCNSQTTARLFYSFSSPLLHLFSFFSLSLHNSMTASHHTFTYHHSSSLLDSPQHHPSDDLLHLKPQHLSGTTPPLILPPFFLTSVIADTLIIIQGLWVKTRLSKAVYLLLPLIQCRHHHAMTGRHPQQRLNSSSSNNSIMHPHTL